MKKEIAVLFLPVLVLFSACATFDVSGDIQSGRRALINGEPQVALAHFERVAKSDPKHISTISPLSEAVWTYLGRTHYAMRNLPEARKSLEQALSHYPQDPLAKLYLGLTLIRQQNEQAVIKPFSLDELVYALNEGVSPERVAALIRQRGISFQSTGAAESALKKVGANDQLIREIKGIGAAQKGPMALGGQGIKEVETGMKELHVWLEQIPQNTSYGQFWDPGREIRSQLESNLRMISAGKIDTEKLLAGGEWIGLKIEQEADVARRDEREHDRRMQQMR